MLFFVGSSHKQLIFQGSRTMCTSFPSWAPADPTLASPALSFPWPGRPWTCPRPWCPAVRAAGEHTWEGVGHGVSAPSLCGRLCVRSGAGQQSCCW